MYGLQPRGGGVWRETPPHQWAEQQPSHPWVQQTLPQPQPYPQFAAQQQFNNYQGLPHFQNPGLNNFYQNREFVPQNANLGWQSTNGSKPPPPLVTPSPSPPAPPGLEQSQQPRPKPTVPTFSLTECSRAVTEARRNSLALGDSVSAFRVSEAALAKLKGDSWESLGYQMKHVPALQQIMALEAKMNTFIHCFVGVRNITSLYDLELAICETFGVKMFEELELGPLVRHPLVSHYFKVSPDTKEAFRIRSEELISHLHDFLHVTPHEGVEVRKFLDYIAEKKSLDCKEKLMVHIQKLGWHIKLFRDVTKLESTNRKKLKEKFGVIRERSLLSSEKGNLDDMSQHLSSSEDDSDCADEVGTDDCADGEHEPNQHGEDTRVPNLSPPPKRADLSTCPCPSVPEEMTSFGLKHQVGENNITDTGNASKNVKSCGNKRKRKVESICSSGSTSLPSKLTKGDNRKISHNEDHSSGPLISESTKAFITTWKETFRDNSVEEVINRMCPNSKFDHPVAGLLDVAVQSIKCGLWDGMCDTFQTYKQEVAIHSISDKGLDYLAVEDESAGKSSRHEKGILIDDIIKKLVSYFCHDENLLDFRSPTIENKFSFLRKLFCCESWLIEQLSLKDFGCLGHGDFLMFLERHLPLLPNGLKKYLIGELPDDLKDDNLAVEIAEGHSSDGLALVLSKPDDRSNSNELIEAIRRDEFGLDSSHSPAEDKLLMKQHTRLGRALFCLSQELYSQHSHFLLELVQNADDNSYLQSVEPSLTFILQDKGIIVLNNERGFSAESIRALCDVGSSTKRDMKAGYIGMKGIGFKSVFRVTDAPEIHSNGFHIKFDMTEGQIGFILPTVVPPCDINFYSRLISTDNDRVSPKSWKTCICLPFKEDLCQGLAMNNIFSMFSVLHPSLLLFLHRLKCIKLRNMLDNSMIVMRKEVGTDGIVKVSVGKEKMAWLVVSQKLQVCAIRPDAKETEISLAFKLEETGDGCYFPLLQQQPVFAFFPMRTYGLKFILQGDFVLHSSREEVDGNSPWNQWILSKFPEFFVTAQKSFSDLPSFRANPAEAVTAFMSFVPLIGEVDGFFSSLPRMIISKLCMSKCLLMETDSEWVQPCRVLRNWDERARSLLPDSLLLDHLGMGLLRKDISLSDALAGALGIEEYGPKTLLHFMESLSNSENDLRNMGFGWLSAWISEIYLMSLSSGNESDLIVRLKKIPFIPLSDGQYCAVDSHKIWLHCVEGGLENENYSGAFSKLYAKLRIVNPALLSAETIVDSACMGAAISDNVERMLIKVGVQRLTAHEIVKEHILPAICGDKESFADKDLLAEYLSFVMVHLQSVCPICSVERDCIMDHLRSRALIFTNYGPKQVNKEPIHFSKKFGNPIDINPLIDNTDLQWIEIDSIYLKYPITKSVSDRMLKWRSFFKELGITDFVKVVKVEKCFEDLSNSSLNNMELDGDISTEHWESGEMVTILSQLSSGRDCSRCKYFLEILDMLWDDSFSAKDSGNFMSDSCQLGKPFVPSFIFNLQNVKWMVSTKDGELHCPKDLFHDCEQVRSLLGDTVPYAMPKVKSQKLIEVLGIKSVVRPDDILSILQVWKSSKTPFKASISQMVHLYTFIWNESAASKQKILKEISSGAFIFIPHVSDSSPEEIVTGSLLSAKEVFWSDTTDIMDQIKMLGTKCSSKSFHISSMRMLQSLYPTLHDFFVKECGVEELPSADSHLQILMQLSKISLPSQVARTVLEVFAKWADLLKCGSLSDEAIEFLRKRLKERKCTVLPSVQDKWVSLHPSFGLACWSDDDKLHHEFKDLDGVHLIYSTGLLDEGQQYNSTSFAVLMRRLGIPSLSSVVTREAIHYNPTDSNFKASVVNWALPYAQRYMFHLHPDRYLHLKKSGLENVGCIQVVVVEKLYYENVVHGHRVKSQKRFESSSLLKGGILYVTQQADSHSMFLELSRAFFDGVAELQLANFLHMITIMTEAGSTQEQTELFILNNQKVPELPEGESIWPLSSPIVSKKNEKNSADWPPVVSKTASDRDVVQTSTSSLMITEAELAPVTLQLKKTGQGLASSASSSAHGSVELKFACDEFNLNHGSTMELQAASTGRMGELVAYRYLLGIAGGKTVKWVNESSETGLPYDILIEHEGRFEYVEVKATRTRSSTREIAFVSPREWRFGCERGEAFSIAHVIFSGDDSANLTMYRNPEKLCQLGKLRLAVIIQH